MMSAPGWLVIAALVCSNIVALLGLWRAFKSDSRVELNARLDGIVDTQKQQGNKLDGVRDKQSRFEERFDAHEKHDQEMRAEIKTMFESIQTDIRSLVRKPDHEDDIPATRRDLRHMREGLNGTCELILKRVEKLENRGS